jgi:nicotinate-nucleotide adenylyltransferase
MMQSGKKVGIYGGTFDPVHFGHLNTAIEMMENHHLDEIWFCPAKINPHKKERNTSSAEHRVKMLEIALSDLPHFKIIFNELEREGPSYTIDTLRELFEEENKFTYRNQFFLIMGEDSAANFFRWKDPQEIIQLATPLISRRYLSDKPFLFEEDSKIMETLQKGLTCTSIIQISATMVRQRVQKGLYIGHLVPAKVVDYIFKNQLYYYNSEGQL